VDGGLVDPVPVGIARAMGAEVIIAVDLNSRIVSRSRERTISSAGDIGAVLPALSAEEEPHGRNELMRKMAEFYEGVESSLRYKTSEFLHRDGSMPPDIIETVMTSINVMQERITRTNLAVDQPDILIQPRLGELKMMNFDQVEHCIREGYTSVQEQLDDIYPLLEKD
jgi:NTE family protein